MKKLRKSSNNRIIAGVAGGLGEYFNIDPIVIRILFVVSPFVTFGTSLFIYIVCALLMPNPNVRIYYNDTFENSRRFYKQTGRKDVTPDDER